MDHSEDEQSPTKSEQTKQATNVEPSSQSSPRTAEQSQASGSTNKGPDQKMTEQTRSPKKQNRSRTRGPVQSFGLFNPKSKTGSGQQTGQMSPSKSPIHSLFGEPGQASSWDNPISNKGSACQTGRQTRSPKKKQMHPRTHDQGHASACSNPTPHKCSGHQMAGQNPSPKKQMHPRTSEQGHAFTYANPTPDRGPGHQMAERTLSPQKQMNPRTGEQGYTSVYANPTPYGGSGYQMPGQYPSPQKQMHPRTGEQDHTFAYPNPTADRGLPYQMTGQHMASMGQIHSMAGDPYQASGWDNAASNRGPGHQMAEQTLSPQKQMHPRTGEQGYANPTTYRGSGYQMAEQIQSPQKQMHPRTNEHTHSFAGANPTRNILPSQMMGQHMAAMGQIPPRAGDPYQASGWENEASNRGSGYQMEKQTLFPETQMHSRIVEQSYASACAIANANRGSAHQMTAQHMAAAIGQTQYRTGDPSQASGWDNSASNRGYAHQLVVNLPSTSQYASWSGEPDQASGWYNRPSYSGTDQERGEPCSKTKLFVGHLTKNVSDEDVRSLFCCMGTVDECDKVSSDYAFVHMSTPEEANLAIKYLNNTMLLDAHIIVEHAKTPFYPKPKNAGKCKDPKYAGSEAMFIEDDEEDEQIAICMQALQNQSRMQSHLSLQEPNVVPEMPTSFELFSVATNQWSQPRSVLFRNNPQLYSESAGDAFSVSPNSSADDPSDSSASASQHKTDESNTGVNPETQAEPQLLQNPFFDYNLMDVPSWEDW